VGQKWTRFIEEIELALSKISWFLAHPFSPEQRLLYFCACAGAEPNDVCPNSTQHCIEEQDLNTFLVFINGRKFEKSDSFEDLSRASSAYVMH
jgi:hypothetical protein